MRQFLALGLTAGLLAISFGTLSSPPAEAKHCRYSNNYERKLQKRAWRRYQQQRYQYQAPPFYANNPYSYPVNYAPYYSGAPVNTGLLQNLFGLF